MNICLVGPPTVPGYGELARINKVRAMAEYAPVGILSLAAVLEQLGMEPQVMALNKTYYEYLDGPVRSSGADFRQFAVEQVASTSADVFGFGTICSSYPLTLRIAAGLRRLRPASLIMLGGPQASVVDQETLQAFPWIDLVVRGEAEESLPQLLQALSGTGQMEKVPGITFRAGGKIVRNPDAPLIQDMDALPLPAYHRYADLTDSGYACLEIGRGCPFACTFCSTNDFFRRRFRLKSPQRMIEQMTALHQAYGVRRFDLIHDMFTVDRKRVVEFCEALLASGEDFRWSCSARTDCVDQPLIELMAQAGCRGVFFGIETGSPRLQKVIDKGLDLQDAARMVEVTQRHGVSATVSLITGFPEETAMDLRDTVNFFMNAARYEEVKTQFHLLAPLAKTPLHAQYRGQLTLQNLASDISHIGLELNMEDQELVRSWPDIFTSFYALPTTLGHGYLEELRLFLLTGIFQFRWLLHALHEESGGVLAVFESWLQWRKDRQSQDAELSVTRYYLDKIFVQDFFIFLHSRYLPQRKSANPAVQILLDYEIRWRTAAKNVEHALQGRPAASQHEGEEEASREITLESVPELARGVCLVPIDPEASKVILHLRTKGRSWIDPALPVDREFLSVSARDGKHIEVSKLSPLSARLLGLCDGRSNLGGIYSRFAASYQQIETLETLTPKQVCISGIVELAGQGLIVFQPAMTALPQNGGSLPAATQAAP